ncbi:MAG: tRNA (N(6)-L-threonylcarbamoyladenosine(37)-C(2))-methylthiotransferase [archaeon]|nr:tRNA (N(6)-L-threonylcarbamoyladenosine(37)-C(2))-methylthiotransferase [archaeon]
MKVFIETYGCTYNQGDSQIMAGNLVDNGAQIVDSIEEADVIIVNTCYVKLPTENKVVYRIQKLQKEYPDKQIIPAGCMVEINSEKLDKIGPNCSWIGPHKLDDAFNVVSSACAGELSRSTGFTKNTKVGLKKIKKNSLIHIIQICEGCLGACTFCCTRFARGRLNSYPIEDIVAEAKEAISNGAREIQLTAQDTAAFGRDSGEKLSDLIKEVANLEGDFRVRVGMMHPRNILKNYHEIIEAIKLPKVYNFIHLPIQSGSNKVLSEMNRGHSVEDYIKIVDAFKKEIPSITLATDIIVGYPTETDDDFDLTCELLEKVRPSLIHLSKYQHRKGAISSSLKEVPHEVMKNRSKFLSDFKMQITDDENKKLLGSIQNAVIVEQGSKGGFIGKSDDYLPIVISDCNIGDFVTVKIYETTATYLKGKLI